MGYRRIATVVLNEIVSKQAAEWAVVMKSKLEVSFIQSNQVVVARSRVQHGRSFNNRTALAASDRIRAICYELIENFSIATAPRFRCIALHHHKRLAIDFFAREVARN